MIWGKWELRNDLTIIEHSAKTESQNPGSLEFILTRQSLGEFQVFIFVLLDIFDSQ